MNIQRLQLVPMCRVCGCFRHTLTFLLLVGVSAARYVMNFYRTGHLHVMEDLCEISFLQEIQYWGIDELHINACCRERYYRRKDQKETLDVRREFQADAREEDFVGAACPALRRCLWDLLEKPDSSRAARTFGSLSMFFVVVSVANMVLISLDLGEDSGVSVVGVGAPLLFDTLEYVCVVWFTGELALRFLCVRDKCRFSRSIPNVIDLLAILPFYVTLAVESLHGGSTELENMGRVVQVLRLLRSLRMLKLGRHSTGKEAGGRGQVGGLGGADEETGNQCVSWSGDMKQSFFKDKL